MTKMHDFPFGSPDELGHQFELVYIVESKQSIDLGDQTNDLKYMVKK